MKLFASFFVAAAVLVAPWAGGQQPDAVQDAVDAAKGWLALSDADDGAATWDHAAAPFQAAISKTGWSEALKRARQPLGAVKSRKLVSSEFKRSLPGVPDGEYVVIRYDTQFDHKAHAVETVVPMRDADGRWKVSGYFVR
jgi:hypothetical protein